MFSFHVTAPGIAQFCETVFPAFSIRMAESCSISRGQNNRVGMQFTICPADGLRDQPGASGAEESTLAGMYILFSGIYSCKRADQDLFPLPVFHIVIYYCVYL